MKELAFTFGGQNINVPRTIPQGGLSYMQQLLSNALTIFIVIGAFLLVIYIVWAGMQLISSGGDKQKVAIARGRLTSAVVGFILLMVAVGVINLVGYFFKVNLLRLT